MNNPSNRLSWARLARRCCQALLGFCLLSGTSVFAQQADSDLTKASLEDLMKMEVTSVSKKEEKLFGTAAAIYVITKEDIRRSGAHSLPDILRMAPGVDVAQIDGSKWAVSARGFNGRFANKLLVLIDGRTIYSPETSGVYWEVQDLLFEDIERIEIIRGPGGTLWGSNAVNGVINIITRRAEDTQGGLVIAGSGSHERGLTGIRYGGQIGNAYYRLYAKYFDRGPLVDALKREANDGHSEIQGGGRLDWRLGQRDSITIQGDAYVNRVRETPMAVSPANPFLPSINRPGDFGGGNLLGQWNHSFSAKSETTLKLYYDRFRRDIYDLPESINIFDIDFQHHIALGSRNDLVWGTGYRLIRHRSESTSVSPVQYNPAGESDGLFNIFAQDEVIFVKDRLKLIFGAKLERLDEDDQEAPSVNVQPNIRLSWTPARQRTLWAAVSRAVRAQSRNDEDIRIDLAAFHGNGGIPVVLALFGNRAFKPEVMLGYEFGYREQVSRRVSIDVAAFYSLYDRLETREPGAPFFESDPLPPHIVLPLEFNNLMEGKTYGAEASVKVNLSSAWQMSGSYSFLRMQLHRLATSHDPNAELLSGNSPQHQFQIHSFIKLPRNFEFDGSIYYVSRLPLPQVPAYTRIDLRLGWRPAERVELSAGGKNLAGTHTEYGGQDIGVVADRIKPSVYGKVTWSF